MFFAVLVKWGLDLFYGNSIGSALICTFTGCIYTEKSFLPVQLKCYTHSFCYIYIKGLCPPNARESKTMWWVTRKKIKNLWSIFLWYHCWCHKSLTSKEWCSEWKHIWIYLSESLEVILEDEFHWMNLDKITSSFYLNLTKQKSCFESRCTGICGYCGLTPLCCIEREKKYFFK